MAGPLLSLKYLQCTFSFFGYAGSSLLQGLFSSYGEPSYSMGFSDNSVGKESPCRAGDLDWEDSLEKEMATHSSILAWRIPWTEESRGLQSMGSQRVGHDLVIKQQ